jgi:hypothetical protein
MTVGNQWNKYKNQDIGNHTENCGRKTLLDEDTKQRIIDRVKLDCWMTAAALSRDKDLNPEGESADTIERVLNEAAYRPTVIPDDVNKEKRLDLCRYTKKWKSIFFFDECWICAEAFHLR